MSTRVVNVCKDYGRVKVLHGVNLEVADGEFVALLGASGCGKTTLLRILAGFERPTSGEIYVDGDLISTPHKSVQTERRNLGMVFQSHALWPHVTVADHVQFPLRYQRGMKSKPARAERVAEVLRLTGLSELRDRMPHQLSGGQQQRLSLARAIASEPALLLMDEPLSSLDANLRDDMRREIQLLHRATQASVVYVTHDQSEALAMADRVVVLNDGRIEQVGTPEEIYSRPATRFIAQFVGKANLVRGTWSGETFRPGAGSGKVSWDGRDVAAGFGADTVFPARPDQLTPRAFDAVGNAIVGTVETAQYQGRDVKYTVAVGDELWQMFGPPVARPGEKVAVEFRRRPGS